MRVFIVSIRQLVLIVLLAMPFLSAAQQKGIVFERGMNWSEIKAKAKRENKYIFIDCFATWCGPCKFMDRAIYTDPAVGRYADSQFISVKVQFDSTLVDNVEVKNWHSTAHALGSEFAVSAFPTYLFFSPEGKAVHKDIGQKSTEGFLKTLHDATNASRQFYTLRTLYQSKRMPFDQMSDLIQLSNQNGEKQMAKAAAEQYIRNYLFVQKDSLNTKDNLRLVYQFYEVISSKDEFFKRLLKDGSALDKIAGFDGYALDLAKKVIKKEEVLTLFEKARLTGQQNPDWVQMAKNISKKYNKEISDELVMYAKISWFRDTKQYADYAHALVENVEKAKPETVKIDFNGLFFLNNNAWNVFLHSTDTSELAKAIRWVDYVLAVDSNFQIQDTKANLLYKYGRKEEAIALEEKVLQTVIETKMVQNYIDRTKKVIEKMKAGLPTWD